MDETADLFNDDVLSCMTKTPPQPDEGTQEEYLTYLCNEMLRDAPTGATWTPRVDTSYCPTDLCAELQFTPSAAKLMGKELRREELLVVYVAKQGMTAPEPVIEKTFDVLDANEIKKQWPFVQAAIREQVKSWHDLGTIKMRRRKELRNI